MIYTKYSQFINEEHTSFNFKDVFLRLTDYTVPAGYEHTLEPVMMEYVPGLKKDAIGNYYVTIGKSKTLFTSHLDTYSKTRKKVNHIIEGNIIKTDGTTVLGGDNKNGVTILLYMINKSVPGTYFFFIGEESIVNGVGCYGSTNAMVKNRDFFSQFDRAIAFDRRGKGSFVVRQSARWCASNEFADATILEYKKQGLQFGKDNAYRTDSAVFMDIIPEITNISSGGAYEHTFIETTDIDYVRNVAIASSNIPWDSLPVVRKPSPIPKDIKMDMDITEELTNTSKRTFSKVRRVMGAKGYICVNASDFQPGAVMVFDKFLEEKPVRLVIKGEYIKCIDGDRRIGKFREGDITEFIRRQKLKPRNFYRSIIMDISKKMNADGELSIEKLNEILNGYDITIEDFKQLISDANDDEYIKFYGDKIYLDIRVMQKAAKKRQEDQKKVLNDPKKAEMENNMNHIKDTHVMTGKDFPRIRSFIRGKNLKRYFSVYGFNSRETKNPLVDLGTWDNHIDCDSISDCLRDSTPDIIYDKKLKIFYIKK